MTGLTWALVVGLVLIVAWTALRVIIRVHRLDRLHIRVDAARAGLDAALERRAAAALRVAAAVPDPPAVRDPPAVPDAPAPRLPTGRAVRDAALLARAAAADDRGDRESAENALGRLLAHLDRSVLAPDVRAELDEAEQVLVLARRMHNDAVRDTLGLRSRRMVRWLHLAGTAPVPAYFEIADAATRTGVTTTASTAPADGGGEPRS